MNAAIYAYQTYRDTSKLDELLATNAITQEEYDSVLAGMHRANTAGYATSTAIGMTSLGAGAATFGVGTVVGMGVNIAATMAAEKLARGEALTVDELEALAEERRKNQGGGQQPANNVVPEQTKSSSSQVPAPIPRQAYAQQSTSERNIVKTSYSGGNQNTVVNTSSNSGYARSVNGGSAVQRPTSNNAQTTNSGYVPRTSGGYGSGELVSVGNNSKRNLHQVFNQGTFVKSNKGIVKASSEGIEKAQPVTRIAAIDAVRYRAYGITALEEYRIKSIQYLESKVIDKVTYDSDNTAHLEIDPTTVLNDCMAYFGIKSASSKDAADWSAWFTGRFLPVFTKYMSTIKSVGGRANITDINRTLKMIFFTQ